MKQMEWGKWYLFLKYAANKTDRSGLSLVMDAVKSVFKYNIALLEYFQFRFFELDDTGRREWAGTGYMYEYQLRMNPRDKRHILDDKILFAKEYAPFMKHAVIDLSSLKTTPKLDAQLLANPAGKVVLKVANGKAGKQVVVMDSVELTPDSLIATMEREGLSLVEEFIQQHPKLQALSPSAVNTVRIFTQLDKDNIVHILGCRLRISVNSPVDNMAAGNLAAPVEEQSGVVCGEGVYSDITKDGVSIHPITGVPIVGFQIPYWNETMSMVKEAALLHPQNRSIGWDVVITEQGPGLIEGNHDWCKLLWQIPVKRGLKSKLETFADV